VKASGVLSLRGWQPSFAQSKSNLLVVEEKNKQTKKEVFAELQSSKGPHWRLYGL
jgi:hypothetical protein